MLQSRFDELRERLLHAGVAPRHVRRYIAELRDHFDDLVREESASGTSRSVAEAMARTRLGCDGDLADVMLARPDVRSLMARYPWAVFGLGPVALVLAVLAAALAIEMGVLSLAHAIVPHATSATREWFVFGVAVWNTLATYVAPLAIAVILSVAGLRQRMPAAWVFAGIAIACCLGAFQQIHFTDDGHHGELSFGSAFLPPFLPGLVVGGLYRAAVTATLAAAIYWYGMRRQNSDRAGTTTAATLAAE
jgi:hypothetical protein